MVETFKTPNPYEVKFYKYLFEKHDVILNAPVKNRNYLIEYENVNFAPIINLILINPAGSTMVNLNNLLPESWSFSEANMFSAEFKHKKVTFDKARLDSKGFVFSLLHEVAHSHQGQGTEPIKTAYNSLNKLNKLKISFTTFLRSFVIEYKKLEATDQHKYHPSLFCFEETKLSKKFRDQFFRIIATRERNAWAEALILGRHLEKLGFNVLSEFQSLKEINEYVSYCLATYEYSLFNSHLMFGETNSLQKLFLKNRKLPM